jgi:phosphate-selective porin OprO/OprP
MKLTTLAQSLLVSMSLGGIALAGEVTSSPKSVIVEEAPSESLFDKIWAIPSIYKNNDNAFLQEFKIIGRYQGQYANVESDQGDYSDWENRRWRIGAQAKLFNMMKLVGQIGINDDFDPFYRLIDEAYVQFDLGVGKLSVGKHKPKFTHEYSTSSRYISTFERSLLVNRVAPLKSAGATWAGKAGDYRYSLGLFSGDGNREFGDFNQGVFSLVTVGRDLDFADWTLGYLYNGEQEGINARGAYQHSFSNALVFGGDGPFKVGTDLIYASGFEDDAYGVVILPTYDISDRLQLVGRYQYAHGNNDSLVAQGRYELAAQVPNLSDRGRGEDYNAIYAGLNYFIYGDKLKLMSGIEYSDLSDGGNDGGDFNGWSVFAGVRMFF